MYLCSRHWKCRIMHHRAPSSSTFALARVSTPHKGTHTHTSTCKPHQYRIPSSAPGIPIPIPSELLQHIHVVWNTRWSSLTSIAQIPYIETVWAPLKAVVTVTSLLNHSYSKRHQHQLHKKMWSPLVTLSMEMGLSRKSLESPFLDLYFSRDWIRYYTGKTSEYWGFKTQYHHTQNPW